MKETNSPTPSPSAFACSAPVFTSAESGSVTEIASSRRCSPTPSLAATATASYPVLTVALDLASADGQTTPRVNSLKVLYTTAPALPALTLTSSPARIVYGSRVKLSGTLTQGSAPLGGQTVSLSAQVAGSQTFTPLPPATTDPSGAFSLTVAPTKKTTYKASFAGVAMEPTVTVGVAWRITLRAAKRGSGVLFTGKVAPKRRGKRVVVQVKTRHGWKTVAKGKLSKRSTFKLLGKLKHGKYRFRALTPADAQHLAGTSRTVALKV